jgi:hypothetical protein
MQVECCLEWVVEETTTVLGIPTHPEEPLYLASACVQAAPYPFGEKFCKLPFPIAHSGGTGGFE